MTKNTIDLQYLRTIKAIVSLQGREYLTHPGLLRVAHEHGLKSIQTELVSWDPEKRAAVMRTIVEGDRGSFTGYGDATPENVAKHLKDATLRMAETRAINRALRLYTGLGMTTTEELPGDHPGEEEAPAPPPAPAGQPRTQSQPGIPTELGWPAFEALLVDWFLPADRVGQFVASRDSGWHNDPALWTDRQRGVVARRLSTVEGLDAYRAWAAGRAA